MTPLMKEYRTKYPSLPLYLRGDSGLAALELYDACEEHDCKYAICLKDNKKLRAYAADADEALYRATKQNQTDYAVEYGEFQYQVSNWSQPRRVVSKVEKTADSDVYLYRDFIKECQSGFDFGAVSSHLKVVNANRLCLHMLTYNLFNWFHRLVLPANMKKQQIAAIRMKLLKIAAEAVPSARIITFKLCSSCPYKKEYYATLKNIWGLRSQLG